MSLTITNDSIRQNNHDNSSSFAVIAKYPFEPSRGWMVFAISNTSWMLTKTPVFYFEATLNDFPNDDDDSEPRVLSIGFVQTTMYPLVCAGITSN